MAKPTLHGTLIVTYRCNAGCAMCGCHTHPTRPQQEFTPALVRRLPPMAFANVTGGEPFLRQDLGEILEELFKKARRVVVSTNGYFTQRILAVCRRFPRLGVRISLEGIGHTNDALRGLPGGFARGMATLHALARRGHQDIGIATTLQSANCGQLLPMHRLAAGMGVQFATAAVHNSFYFHKQDNEIADKPRAAAELLRLSEELLRSPSPKNWGRAYFNYGLARYAAGLPRPLPCAMGQDAFFVDPFGDVLPCNGSAEKWVMGNLHRQSWRQLWHSPQAQEVRRKVQCCERNCWMIGSASPAMQKNLLQPGLWVLRHKLPGQRPCLS